MTSDDLDRLPAILYLLHIDPPFTRGRRHYLGYTTLDLRDRIHRHERGSGAAMLRAAVAAGHQLRVVMTETYETARQAWTREIAIKRSGHYDRTCPECGSVRRRPHG